jgi:hypothetical protein
MFSLKRVIVLNPAPNPVPSLVRKMSALPTNRITAVTWLAILLCSVVTVTH